MHGVRHDERESRGNEACGETTATSAVCDITPHTRGDHEANAPWIAHLETLKPALAKQNEIDVYFKYGEPMGVYEVTILFYPKVTHNLKQKEKK